MNRLRYSAAVGCVALAVAAVAPTRVYAQGGVLDCSTLADPDHLIYMAGTTAVMPVIRLLGARLKQIGVTLLWNENDEGCHQVFGLAYPDSRQAQRPVFTQYTEAVGQPGLVIPANCNGTYNQLPDLVINDVPYTSCQFAYNDPERNQLPPGLGEFEGPVQGLVPIVASSYMYYDDIAAEELQDLYVCGAAAKILLTFTSDADILGYDPAKSGMHELWARAIGLTNGLALATGLGGRFSDLNAETMVTLAVGPTTTPDLTFGYTSTEFYDQYRDRVRALKVRGPNQELAYLPDSDLTSTDKLNLREGRYTLQGSLRLVAAIDGATGKVSNAAARHMIDWLQGNPPETADLNLPFDVNQVYAERGVVPQCAMKVTHAGNSTAFKHYTPAQPCHCSFQLLATGKTSLEGCVPCTDASACQAGQQCSHGYCE